jgi:hypothetical protein
MLKMEHRIPVVKVNTQKEALARAETRLNNLLSGLSEVRWLPGSLRLTF